MLAQLLTTLASLSGYRLEFSSIRNPNPIRLWETDEGFNHIVQEIGERTAMGKRKLYMLYQFACNARGNIAEVGVYKGGSSYLMASASPANQLYAFDTFEGMPPTDSKHDLHREGDFADFPSDTVAWLETLPNVKVCEGLFPHETGHFAEHKTFSLVHIDVDIYSSVKDCLAFFYPRMENGGFLVTDDYGPVTTPGGKKAWDEFFADKPEKTVYLPTGQAFIVKASR